MQKPLRKRIMDGCRIDDVTDCWLWEGATQGEGYAVLNVDGRQDLGHRTSYRAFVGPIPPGKTIDHLCRNHACLNPDHLQPVTRKENVLRGDGLAVQNLKKTHCKYGHPFDENNTLIRKRPSGSRAKTRLQSRRCGEMRQARICRTCLRASKREQAARARIRKASLKTALVN